MRVHVLNRSATKSLRGKTPYECWYGRKPNVSNFRTFGSLVHVKVTGNLGKLEDRSKEMIFVGYEHGSKAYRCLDHASLKLCISRDVLFEDSTSLSFSINNPGFLFLMRTSILLFFNHQMKMRLKNHLKYLRTIQFRMGGTI